MSGIGVAGLVVVASVAGAVLVTAGDAVVAHRARVHLGGLRRRGVGAPGGSGRRSGGTTCPSRPSEPGRVPAAWGRLPIVGAAAAVGALGLVALFGPGVLVPAVVAALAVRPVHRRVAEARVRRARVAQLPAALEGVAAALRAGASLPAALDEAAGGLPDPLGDELGRVAAAARRGSPLVEVLDGWVEAHPDPATRAAATVLVVAATSGAAPARAVDGVAATLRERSELADERRALSAQARLSGLVLSAAPVVAAVAMGASGSAAGDFLFGTPLGLSCLAVGLALDAGGAWWMARLTRGHP